MRGQTTLGCILVGCLVFLLCANTASSQAVYGSIIGTVTDPQGNAIAAAKITVISVTKATSYESTSNESGNYSVTHLISDDYKLKVESPGFKSYEIPSVRVDADVAIKVDAQLQVGAVTQTVEVTSEIPQLKTDRADVDIEFNDKYISELPVLNRNFTNFELLSPGTQKLVGFSHAATENPQGGGQIFVNGQHFSGTNFELDGTDNQDPILGIIVINPNLDAVTEAKFALQDFDAESGKATAGFVRINTKSGSNSFHGSGFYFYRNSDQEARDPFTNKPGVSLAPATWKQFGGSVGGPIIKNKLFFFGDYQGTKQVAGITNLYTVPTSIVLSTCLAATGFCDLSQYQPQIGNGKAGDPSNYIYDPASSPNSDGSGRGAFCGSSGIVFGPNPTNCPTPFLIPIGRLSAKALKVLKLFPTTLANNNPTNNLVTTGSGPFDQKSFDTRIDYAPRNFQIFGRFSLDYFSLSGKGGLGALGGLGFGPGGLNGSSNVHNYSLATGVTKPIGGKLLTDFRFGWFKYNPKTAYSDSSSSPMDAFGIPGLNSGPGIPGPPETGGLSSFFLEGTGGFSAFGDGLSVGRCNCPLTESEQQVQFVNNWTRTQGNHTIKVGADIRDAFNLRVPGNRTGQLHFDSGATSDAGSGGLSLATFLLGDVTRFERFVSTSTSAAERQKRWFFYGQDSWRVSPKFTLTGGLRWELYFPESVNGKGNGGFANLEEGVIRVAGFGGIGLDGNIKNTRAAFAPRLSVAYQFDSKTVLRMGYGRSYDIGVFGSNFGHVVTQNLPVLAFQNLTDANCTQQPTCGAGTTENRTAVFTLDQGPASPGPLFAGILTDISSAGTLPLLGPNGTVSPGIRPTVQRLPTIDQWNATIQRQLTPTINITISYVGNKGTHVFAGNGPAYNPNQPAIIGGTNIGGNNFKPFTPEAFRRRLFLNGVPAFTYGAPFNYVCCTVDLGYFGNDASNKYNALQVKAEKRFSNGLQFIAHYTYSHAYNHNDDYFSVDPRVAYGPDDFNRNHVFVINTVYELPLGKGKKFMSSAGRATDLLIGGWQVTNTLNYSGGLPWTPSIAECGQISDAGPCRPNKTSGTLNTGTSRDVTGNLLWFTPVPALSYVGGTATTDTCTLARPTSGAFALPACGQIGNFGRNSLRGPRGFFSDMALAKSFSITESVKAQFRFDAYNVFNHPVFAIPANTCVDCGGDAGRIRDIENDASPGSPNGMRHLQFGFRVTF